MRKLFLSRRRRAISSRAILVAPLLAGVLLVRSLARADAPRRHPVDVSDLGRIGAAYPHARELLEQGEEALARGDAKTAASHFEQAATEATNSALAARRHCQALLELGERDEAILVCRRAVQREGSPLDLRMLVRAILSSANPPTFEELYETSLLTARAQKAMPRQPWGYAAMCDIARRLEDVAMLEACQKTLQRLAPDHAETKRAMAGFGPTRSSLGIAIGWGVILFGAVATLGDWIRRNLQRARPARVDDQIRGEV